MTTQVTVSIYKRGFKWCTVCQEKKQTDDKYCDDCGMQLRTKPRSKKKYNA